MMRPRKCRSGLAAGLILMLPVLSGLPSAHGMTLQTVEMTCPYDGTKFSATLQMSGTTFDKTLDLKPTGAIQMPSPLAVCPTNGFVFFKSKLEQEELERLRPLVLSPEYQALKQETPYYRVAFILERTGAPRANVTFALLQSTWEASKVPERYRRYAEELLARLPADVEQARNDGERTTLKLLGGELLRRLSRFEDAERHFTAIAGDLAPNTQATKIAAFEIELIARKDASEHMISEALGTNRRVPAR
jgi:hypothetical protein